MQKKGYIGQQEQYFKKVEKYLLYNKIGEGQFGQVYKSINSESKEEVAIKIVSAKVLEKNAKLNNFVENEVKILTQIDNPFVVKLYDVLRTSNNLYFVYEYCEGGTLEQLLKAQGHLSQPHAAQLVKQILQGFVSLFECNILHRDIKPGNIFFRQGQIKIGDFGFCKQLDNREELAQTQLGSPLYMAPEVLFGNSYDLKADIWSIGVIYYELLYGVCPFETNNIVNLISKINQGAIYFPTDKQVAPKTIALIQAMLVKDPLHRIDWHTLFQKMDIPSQSRDILSSNQNDKYESIQKQKEREIQKQKQKQKEKEKEIEERQKEQQKENEKQKQKDRQIEQEKDKQRKGVKQLKMKVWGKASREEQEKLLDLMMLPREVKDMESYQSVLYEQRSKLSFLIETVRNCIKGELSEEDQRSKVIQIEYLEGLLMLVKVVSDLVVTLSVLEVNLLRLPMEVVEMARGDAKHHSYCVQVAQEQALVDQLVSHHSYNQQQQLFDYQLFTHLTSTLVTHVHHLPQPSLRLLLLAHSALDILLIHIIFQEFYQRNIDFEYQKYFNDVKKFNSTQLIKIIVHKHKYILQNN